ncbi:hypothetical protein [Azospirillum endophyticum]
MAGRVIGARQASGRGGSAMGGSVGGVAQFALGGEARPASTLRGRQRRDGFTKTGFTKTGTSAPALTEEERSEGALCRSFARRAGKRVSPGLDCRADRPGRVGA